MTLFLSLSDLVVCWGLAMDFGVWFVGGLLVIGGFLILVFWCGGGDFAMDFGWVARSVVEFDFAMNFGF